jgi:hypothetical protein
MTVNRYNYHYPDDCCGRCKHAYYNSYGDLQCKKNKGMTVESGAVCDLYLYANRPGLFSHEQEGQALPPKRDERLPPGAAEFSKLFY